jgi:alkylation response protein AidB-like acyl-CoA dehydrogenase
LPAQLASRENLNFTLYDWLRVENLTRRHAFNDHSRETFDALLDLSERLANDKYLPLLKESDRTEPWQDSQGEVHVIPAIREALAATAQAGLFASGFPAELDGLAVPATVYWAAMGLLKAASVAATGFMMLTVANARLIAAFGTPAQIDSFARPQIAGLWFGTMCLSEPQAGSSLADITTRAEPDGEDTLGARYRLRGNKMWISGGDHDASENIVHLVLAKVPGPDGKPIPGTKGISLFIVPKYLPNAQGGAGERADLSAIGERNDIAVAGLNHKMGFRGIPNCLLNLGEGRFTPGGHPGAIGYRVGEVGQGLAQMFQMMNEARVGVGLGAAMLAIRGYQLALTYATERLQGRPLEAKGRVDQPPVPLIRHPDVKRMLLAQKAYAEGALSLVLYAGRLIDEERTAESQEARAQAGALLGLLTPVAKTWPSEWGCVSNDLAIQVHGGYGYTRDFDVEQLYRDNRLNPIHEGTTGIQGIDLLGRKILRERAASLKQLQSLVAATVERAHSHHALAHEADELQAAWDRIGQVVSHLLALNDDARALAHATAFLSAFGHAVVAWLWLDQAALCAAAQDTPFHAGKIAACRFFFETELPRVGPWLDQVTSLSEIAAGMLVEQF